MKKMNAEKQKKSRKSDDSALEVRNSGISGKGLFAIKNINNGEKIGSIIGKIISLDEFFSITQKIRDNTIRFSENEYLSPENQKTVYLNHGCNPNARVVKNGRSLSLYALKNIKSGDEVTMDYSGILAKDDYWIMKCSCGHKDCRSKIKRYNLLPKETIDNYKKNKIIPKYILDIEEE